MMTKFLFLDELFFNSEQQFGKHSIKGFHSVHVEMVNFCFGLKVTEFGIILNVPIIPQAGISFNPLGY